MCRGPQGCALEWPRGPSRSCHLVALAQGVASRMLENHLTQQKRWGWERARCPSLEGPKLPPARRSVWSEESPEVGHEGAEGHVRAPGLPAQPGRPLRGS